MPQGLLLLPRISPCCSVVVAVVVVVVVLLLLLFFFVLASSLNNQSMMLGRFHWNPFLARSSRQGLLIDVGAHYGQSSAAILKVLGEAS